MSNSDSDVPPAQQHLPLSLVVWPVARPVHPLVPFALFAGGGGGTLVAAAVVTTVNRRRPTLYHGLSGVGKYYVDPKHSETLN